MRWKDVNPNLPPFIWDDSALLAAEWRYLAEAGQAAGAAKHLPHARKTEFFTGALSGALDASLELEGVAPPHPHLQRCMGDLVQSLQHPLTLQELKSIGAHFGNEDVTSSATLRNLSGFLAWFTAKDSAEAAAAPLTQAALAHLWFESIHPFPFGSGIVARALAEKSLLQHHPATPFTALSPELLARKNEYYSVLDRACLTRNATEWLVWFAEIVIEATKKTRTRMSSFS